MPTLSLADRKKSLKDWDIKTIYNRIGISRRDLAFILGTTERNLMRWLEYPALAEESYRFQMLKEICLKAEGVIETARLGEWLARAREDLGGYAPLTLMREQQGFKDILRLLEAIKSGSYA